MGGYCALYLECYFRDVASLKILLVSQYFWPENFVINDLVRKLVDNGHELTVLTGKPNYPVGKIFTGYSSHGVQRELFHDHIDVFRVPLFPRGGGGPFRLFLNYLSFVISGVLLSPALLRGRKFDLVLVFAPSPITSAIPAIPLKWLSKAHLAVWVQDLWPDSLSATGFIRNKVVLRMVGWIVRGIYMCADTLLVQSKAFKVPVSRYVRKDKVFYYPNSYLDAPPQPAVCDQLPAELVALLEKNFCLVFAGNLGTAQSVETLVSAAERVKHLAGCKLVLVGSGSMVEWIEEQRVVRGLDNLVLAGSFPSSVMPHVFSRTAGLLVTLKREEIFAYTIPSKVQAYLAAGRPIIAALDGEGSRVIEEAEAGLTCDAEDSAGLANCIEQLFFMPADARKKFGQSGREYFLANFEMTRQSERLVEILRERMNKGRRASK